MSKIERFLSDPRYQALDDAGKKEKLDLFFNKYVTQDARYALLDEEGKARVYSKFMSKYYGEPEAKAPKQKTPFSGLISELKETMSLTQSAEAISTRGEVETQTLDRRNKAYQKVMADREEALRIIDRERNLKQAIPQDRVAAGQQFIKKVKSMQDAPKYPIKSQYTVAMERLQPNSYTDPIERQVAYEIVNKEKLDKAQREYQRIAERMASATPEERKEIAKSLAVQQTLIDYYATGMTAAERAAYQAGQEGSESFRMVKALGVGSIDLASSVYQLFNPDSKFARTINAYSAGLLEQSGNPLEDAFAQVFYSMPMTLGYFITSGIAGAVGTATKAASIATKAGEVASLMHSVNINAYMTAKKYSEAISGYGSATAVPEGVFLAGSTAALVESSIEMLSDTAQAKIVLGQAKRIGRRGAEQIIKNSLSGKIAGYGTRLATGMAESAITEFTEEILQGASGMIFDVMSNQREVPSLEEVSKELLYSGAVGALGGITIGLGGGIMVQSSNYQNWREVKKQAASGNEHAARLWEARSILDKSNPNGEVWKSDVQRAYDVIKSDLHAVTENRYQEDNPSIVQAMAQMYDAYAMVDMIKSPQQEAVREAMQAGVQRILDQKRATAIQEPTQKAAATEPQSVENTIIKLVQEGNIEAAENALNEAVKNRVTGINVPYLRTLVNESKAYAERTAKEAAAQKERRDIIDKYGKYADMSHSELQDEAKKRGLKAGGKSTDIMARLKESDQAKPKAETTPAKPAAKKPFATNEPTEQQQDRAIKESLIAEETPKKASKYESMGYNALQKEAKKRGINPFGIKKVDLIRQIEEKDASTEKAKAEKSAAKPKLVKTEWISKLEEVPDKIEGSIVARRSDWDKSLVSELSGREIVHVYWIDKGDGEVKPYGIQSAAKIMGWSKAETDRKIRQLANEHKAKEAEIKAWRSEAREHEGAASPRAALLTWEPLQAHKEQDFWAAIDRDFVFAHKDNTYRAIPKNQSEHIEAYRREGWDIQSTDQARQDTAPVKAEGVEADASVERARTDTKPEPQKTKAAPAPDQFADTSKMIEAEISKRDEAQRRNIDKAIADGYDTLDVTSADLRGSWYLTKKGKKNVTPMVWVSEQNLKYAENALANKPEAKEDVVKPEAELNVLKKELADINRTLSLLKEEYDRLLKIAPDDRTAEQDKRIEYIDDLLKIRTIRKSEIETEIAGYESQKSDKMMPKQQTADPVKAAEDSKSEVMSRSTFQEQYRQAQEGKLPKEQIDAQLKLYDAMMDTYAKEMGITIDEAYAEVIDSVTADEPVDGTARRSGARYQA
ncbi:MAG TPA: hypothetical protein P5092_16800, partial [Ruminococcus sp.]|nr:hypothetical protein [Ruminococcus sp.]